MNYICPMHPEIVSQKPGECPKCGMDLVKGNDQKSQSYTPLVVIIGLILLGTVALAIKDFSSGVFSWENTMANFMAGFFLVFAGAKLLDIKGFADAYSTYDLLAQRLPQYGYIYPFIELFLGLAYLTRFELATVNWINFLVMSFSGIGVLVRVAQKKKIRCACLGTIIKLPLTTVTLIEDFGMAAMALAQLLLN